MSNASRRLRLLARLNAPRAAHGCARAALQSRWQRRQRWREVRLQRPVRQPAARLAAARRPLTPLRASPRAFCLRLRRLLYFLHCSRVSAILPRLNAELYVGGRRRSRHPRHRHSHTTSTATASDLSARREYSRQ